MTRPKIIIEVQGGCITNVVSTGIVDVHLFDHDWDQGARTCHQKLAVDLIPARKFKDACHKASKRA